MSQPCGIAIGDVLAEFDGASLGDARLDERLRRIVALAAMDPGQSFPEQMATVADREALYRFLANPKVTLAGVLDGHVHQTHERMRGRQVVRVVHDTTVFRFLGDREGLGEIRGGAKGFLGHVALAVAADETREPLGVVGVHPYIHQDAVAHRGMTPRQRQAATHAKPRAAKESARWERMAQTVSATVPDGVMALHVMDQEADDYHVLSALHAAGLHYVIRADPKRRTTEAKRQMKEVLARQPGTVFRTVPLAPRSANKAARTRGRYQARAERQAALHVRWATVHLKRRSSSDAALPTLTLHAVHVVEPTPPPGEVPIEWMLVTSEPVQTLDDATAVVDHYRARWLIEEYFKALKTGCAFEKRQLTSLPALLRALALFMPMAWRLLVLRHLGRAPQPQPVGDALDRTQLLILRTLLARRNYALPHRPTMQDAMWGVAALGGHIKNNGAPGWLVLGRGLTRLLDTEIGWRLARETRCDQS
jgi:hypothetical protein